MAAPASILIDTNVIINLEDNKEIGRQYADLSRICNQYGIKLFTHASCLDDVARDRDDARRRISLSKLEKYPRISRTPVTTAEKAAKFGAIRSENDEVDTDLLFSLGLNVADILVTDDKGMISRVSGTPLDGRVLTIQNAVDLLQDEFGVVTAEFKHVHDRTCNEFNPDDEFFRSLHTDYPAFDTWFRESCIATQRPCWAILQASGIGGLIIYKPESRQNEKSARELADLGVAGTEVLKLCLFKVDENSRGEKFGEQLLKKAMVHAYKNEFDSAYLTVFPRHKVLIDLLEKFGFEKCGTTGNGERTEDVYFKKTKVPVSDPGLTGFEFHKSYWPRVRVGSQAAYLVPVQPEFHDRLFPEAAARYAPAQMKLFEDVRPQTPGNAIRKVYVCNAQTTSIEPGSLLFFYRSGNGAITSIGVLESYETALDLPTLKSFVGSRSVYTEPELASKVGGPVLAKAVNFYYAADLTEPIKLSQMREIKISQPQSIASLDAARLQRLMALLNPEDRGIFYD